MYYKYIVETWNIEKDETTSHRFKTLSEAHNRAMADREFMFEHGVVGGSKVRFLTKNGNLGSTIKIYYADFDEKYDVIPF